MNRLAIAWSAAALGVALGCGTDEQPAADATAPLAAQADGAKYVLSAEPEGAQGVRDVRESAADGDEVVVIGRIGGSENPWLDGYAGFSVVDPSVKHCGELGDDGCPKPWDYC